MTWGAEGTPPYTGCLPLLLQSRAAGMFQCPRSQQDWGGPEQRRPPVWGLGEHMPALHEWASHVDTWLCHTRPRGSGCWSVWGPALAGLRHTAGQLR